MAMFCVCRMALAEPLEFELIGAIATDCGPALTAEQTLTGRFVYDPETIHRLIGTDYYPDPGTALIAFRTGDGFELELGSSVISVQPGASTDRLYNQTFLSEGANEWHIVIEIAAAGGSDGWLKGDSSLPAAYPAQFEYAYLTAYLTDEYEWAQALEARICSIQPVSAPPPPVRPATPGAINSIPTLGQWGLALMICLVLLSGSAALPGRASVTA